MLTLQNSYVLTETWPSAVAGQTSTVGNSAALAEIEVLLTDARASQRAPADGEDDDG